MNRRQGFQLLKGLGNFYSNESKLASYTLF